MNILTAPIIDLIPVLSNNMTTMRKLDNNRQRNVAGSYLKFGTLLCLLLIVAGGYFIIDGQEGAVEIETPLGTLKTGVVGIVLIFIGVSLYLGIGKILIDKGGAS